MRRRRRSIIESDSSESDSAAGAGVKTRRASAAAEQVSVSHQTNMSSPVSKTASPAPKRRRTIMMSSSWNAAEDIDPSGVAKSPTPTPRFPSSDEITTPSETKSRPSARKLAQRSNATPLRRSTRLRARGDQDEDCAPSTRRSNTAFTRRRKRRLGRGDSDDDWEPSSDEKAKRRLGRGSSDDDWEPSSDEEAAPRKSKRRRRRRTAVVESSSSNDDADQHSPLLHGSPQDEESSGTDQGRQSSRSDDEGSNDMEPGAESTPKQSACSDDENSEENSDNIEEPVVPSTPRAQRTRYTLRTETQTRRRRSAEKSEALMAIATGKRRRSGVGASGITPVPMRARRKRHRSHIRRVVCDSSDSDEGSSDAWGEGGSVVMDRLETLYGKEELLQLDDFVVDDERNPIPPPPSRGRSESKAQESNAQESNAQESKAQAASSSSSSQSLPQGVAQSSDGLLSLGVDYFDPDEEEHAEDDAQNERNRFEPANGNADGKSDSSPSLTLDRAIAAAQAHVFLLAARTRFSAALSWRLPGALGRDAESNIPFLLQDWSGSPATSKWLIRALGLAPGLHRVSQDILGLVVEYIGDVELPHNPLYVALLKAVSRTDWRACASRVPQDRIRHLARDLSAGHVVGDAESRSSLLDLCRSQFISNRFLRRFFDDARSLLEARQMGTSDQRRALERFLPFYPDRNRNLLYSACCGRLRLTRHPNATNEMADYLVERDDFVALHPAVARKGRGGAQPGRLSQLQLEDVLDAAARSGTDQRTALREAKRGAGLVTGLTARVYDVYRRDPDACASLLAAMAPVVCGICQKYPRLITNDAIIVDYSRHGQDIERSDGEGSTRPAAGEFESDSEEEMGVDEEQKGSEEEESGDEGGSDEEGSDEEGSGREPQVGESGSSSGGDDDVPEAEQTQIAPVGVCCGYKLSLGVFMMEVLRGAFTCPYGPDLLPEEDADAIHLVFAAALLHLIELAQEAQLVTFR